MDQDTRLEELNHDWEIIATVSSISLLWVFYQVFILFFNFLYQQILTHQT